MTTRPTISLLAFALLLTCGSFSPSLLAQAARAHAGEAEMHQHAPATPSTVLTVTGLDGKTISYSPTDLKAFTHKTVTVLNEHSKVSETYTGVPLTELLMRSGVPVGKDLRGKAFLIYILAEGTDHYRVLYSLSEVDPVNHSGDVIVADTLDGMAISNDGVFKLVSSEDKRPARWVRNLMNITVGSAK